MRRKSEDISAVSHSYEKYRWMVFKVAMKYSVDVDTAQDITQEVFITLMHHIDDIKEESHLKRWLAVTTKNKALNYKRDSKAEQVKEYIEETLNHELSYVPSLESEYLESMMADEKDHFVQDILGELKNHNERWYEAVKRVYYFGKRQKDVAEEMGVSPEMLHSALQRARKWMRNMYRERYEEIGK